MVIGGMAWNLKFKKFPISELRVGPIHRTKSFKNMNNDKHGDFHV